MARKLVNPNSNKLDRQFINDLAQPEVVEEQPELRALYTVAATLKEAEDGAKERHEEMMEKIDVLVDAINNQTSALASSRAA